MMKNIEHNVAKVAAPSNLSLVSGDRSLPPLDFLQGQPSRSLQVLSVGADGVHDCMKAKHCSCILYQN